MCFCSVARSENLPQKQYSRACCRLLTGNTTLPPWRHTIHPIFSRHRISSRCRSVWLLGSETIDIFRQMQRPGMKPKYNNVLIYASTLRQFWPTLEITLVLPVKVDHFVYVLSMLKYIPAPDRLSCSSSLSV